MLKRRMVAPALLASALIALGCGSSKSSTQTSATQAGSTVAQTTGTQTQPTGTGAPLTRTVFINKADLICAHVNAVRASNKINSEKSFIRAVNSMSTEEQKALHEMAQIAPPAAIASAWNHMISDYKSLATVINEIKRSISEKNYHKISSLLVLSLRDQRKVAVVAKGAGFHDCGEVA